MEYIKNREVEEIEEFDEISQIPDDAHVLHMWTPLEFDVKSDYNFVPKAKLFRLASSILYLVAAPILFVYNKITLGFSIKGWKKLRKVKGAKITVSNHIHPMDCTMNAIVNIPHKTYFPTIKENFQIPIIRDIIKLLNAIPIPEKMEAKKQFVREMNELLQKGKTIHFYPEAAMHPYCKKLRNFKKGAFELAVENNVPIVPFVYIFKEPEGIYKLWKDKPCIQVQVLDPVYPREHTNKGEEARRLKEEVYQKMNEVIQK